MMEIRNKLLLSAAFVLVSTAINAKEISTNIAQMQAMDKTTGRISVVEVPVNGIATFGSFSIVVRDCKTRSSEDTPENFAFVDVADTSFSGEKANIFKGWMLSSSPALNAVEHPIYDVWLLKCISGEVKGKLLTKEQLEARDKMPKFDREELVAKTEVAKELKTTISSDKKPLTYPEVAGTVPVVEEIPLVEPVVAEQPKPAPIPPKEEPLGEDGAPKSLLNFGEPAPQPQPIVAPEPQKVEVIEEVTQQPEPVVETQVQAEPEALIPVDEINAELEKLQKDENPTNISN